MVVHVSGLNAAARARQLRTLFEQFGRVEEVGFVVDLYTGERTGHATVRMSESADVTSAVWALHGLEMGGHRLHVGLVQGISRD